MLENCYQYDLIEAGCDEAGRGCLAGSVFAAAVVLPKDFHHPLLNDSKQMTERRREQLRSIIEREAVAWYVAEVTAERIDQINILNASIEGMNIALRNLTTPAEFAVIDGNKFHTDLAIPWRTIVKGDGKYANIAAYSITMTKNLSIDRIRVKRFTLDEAILENHIADEPLPDRLMEEKDNNAIISDIITKLPPLQQKVFKMKDLHGYENEEIAA